MATQFRRPYRREEQKLVAGVASGLGEWLGLDANLVRLSFGILTLAGGLGVLVYLGAWALMPPAPADVAMRPIPEPVDLVRVGALGLVVLGGLSLGRALGLWPGDAIVWPLAFAGFGFGLLWLRPPSDEERDEANVADWPLLDRLPPSAGEAVAVVLGTRRGALVRIAGGGVLIATGITFFLVSVGSWKSLRTGFVAGLIVAAGLALLLGPALLRMARELTAERRDRIRSEERADMAAHLHDSVLQTLALVQRKADDPREVVRLARRQERELRAWLLTGEVAAPEASETSLGLAMEAITADVEEECGVPIELVRVRDCPLDGLEPLVSASREAMLNASRHSGAPSISVYVEVEPDRASVFVRDRGKGFDPDAVPADRGGIAASIVGRISRRGGTASVRSTPGEGTEVELVLPRVRAQEPA